MKNRTKRGAALLLSMTLLSCLAGCTEKKEESGVCELTYYAYNEPQKDEAKVIAKVNEYLIEKIGVKVNWINIAPAEYAEKMRMTFASNEEFDVCFTASYVDFYNSVNNDVFMPLDELLQNEGKEIYEMTPEYFFDASTVNGEIYALPVIKDVAQEWVLNCKQWLLDKYSIDTSNVKTLADMTPILQIIKDNEPDIVPILMRGNNTFFRFLGFEDISGSSLGAFTQDNYDKIVNQYETEEAKEFFKLMREWYQKGFIRTDAATAVNDSDIRASGNFFAAYGGYLPYSEIQTDPDEKNHMNVIHGLYEPRVVTSNTLGAAFAISSNSKNPQKAMEFINLINTDEYVRNLLAFGIEGEHWVEKDGKFWTLPEGIAAKTDTGYAPSEYPQGNRFILKVQEGIPEDIWKKFEEFNNNSFISPALGFTFNPENVSTELTAIENAYQEFAPSLMVGAVDPEVYLPQFLEKLKAVGSEKVIAEMQKQYDEWKANK